ncbi:hypothetical protein MMC30_009142 [Trapelia coarctata]|nr:hypothetical protein [Trapelia coarctata]
MLFIKDAARTSLGLRDKTTIWDSTNLLYDQSVLEKDHTHLHESVDFIRTRGGSQWPRCKDANQEAKAAEAARVLLRHYEDLTRQTERALARYRGRMNLLMNSARIAETNKTIMQAKEVTKLTRLALVYIPLSFTASFFGMNIGIFVNGTPTRIWVWFAVSVPVMLISLILMKWDVVEVWKASWASMLRITGFTSASATNDDDSVVDRRNE